MGLRLPGWARAAGFVLAAALLLPGLRALAGFMVETQWRHQAESKLEALRQGEPLWRWSLRRPRDLVAGRPFGSATATATGHGLRVISHDGEPFDLGLPVMQPLDLAHWPLLHLVMATDGGPAEISLVVQERPEGPVCTAAAPALSGHGGDVTIDLRTLEWTRGDGQACPPPDVLAYMLRLRLRLPAGSALEWREAALLAAKTDPPFAVPTIVLSTDDATALLEQRAAPPTTPATPLVLLPRSLPVETWLALRDRLLLLRPGAVVAPAGATLVPRAHGEAPAWLGWTVAVVYGLLLLHAGLRRTHPAWELALLAAGSLWLIAGMQWGLRAFPPAVAAFVEALAWAAWQAWRRRPADWRWLGGGPRDWLMPLALVPLAWGLAAAFGTGFTSPGGRHALLYVAWAGLQQWLMLAILLPRLERWPGGKLLPVLATATMFALLHTPNGTLMQLCFLAELWWAWCFLRSRRLLPIALAHAGCALLVEAGLVGSVLRSLEVSARFLL